MKLSSRIGKILYGSIFIVLLPLLLIFWAKETAWFITLPVNFPLELAFVLLFAGSFLMMSGMTSLVLLGHGMPMNAYPPPLFVRDAVYRYLSHPIYIGFCLICFGFSVITGSSSGAWLVTPAVMLGCAALVYGFEKQDLAERFGILPKPLISLPANEERLPTPWERASVILLVFIPWFIAYELVLVIGTAADSVDSYFPFEYSLPVIEWTEILYASTYVLVLSVPFAARSSRMLRLFAVRGLTATVFIIGCFLVIPFTATPRPFIPSSIFGELLMHERTYDGPVAAFPSFHVVWAFIAASALAQTFPRRRTMLMLLAFAISFSCVSTGMHSLLDVFGGIITALGVLRMRTVWNMLRSISERIANSWKEWYIGSIRVINHGAYAGAGTFAGLSIIGYLLGTDAIIATMIVAFSSLICAALWAQFIEGSPALLRPYGYYGGLIGGMFGCVIGHFTGTNIWLLFAAFGTAGPLIQAAGRLRCLVQGCCHGHRSNDVVGIRYTHPRSRVVRLAGLMDISIHPTPLYSILWNIVTGVVLARFWSLALPPTFIAGMYLILNGMGRFVEESFRGEPQTPILGKLRLYQLMAIFSVLSGIIFTMIKTDISLPAAHFNWTSILAAGIFGLFTWFALGVDFPNSNKRFARLV
ncbi:MAG: prolipoprotein diacylglyceryl transferase family protein [Bacteroidota bacterium]